ncbi:MAG: M50 family metallopeptidase [Candidatus Saccharimonadales bacterium]
MLLVLGILIFVLLVVVHELGHMLVARRNGVEAEEFGVGFPPRLYGRKFNKAGTLYSINLLPLGGFVKLKGENAEDKRPGSFGAASFWSQVKILLAGVAMNFIAAFVLFLILALTSMPQLLPNQFTIVSDEKVTHAEVLVGAVSGETPAAKILKSGDRITQINERSIESSEELIETLKPLAGQEVELTYYRDSKLQTSTVEVAKHPEEDRGILGVQPFTLQSSRYGWSAPAVAAGLTWQVTELTAKGVYGAITGLISGNVGVAKETVAGPVGVVAILGGISELGLLNHIVFLMAGISVSLAVLNMLPIPALDGGRVAVLGAFKALKKPLTAKMENAIHGTGFVALMLLIILISIIDVQRFF